MALTLQDVSRIAHLARLELSASEQALMLEQLNGFFGIVEQMSAVDTRGVEPLYTPLSAVQAVELRSKLLAGSYDARAVLSPATQPLYEVARNAAFGPPDAARPLHWNDMEEFIQPKIEGLLQALQPDGVIPRTLGKVRESLQAHAP